ncbi:LLM class flavin-dependent oxidoreductase [Microbacterium sp. NIBRBAC000506063]|uniref:LLM class flavin-dependent oxidoreductase n=1 Tax=Microbacterium sp. NIBRBAC000506063 TaxID=2734618 RepID=UPI001BB4E449|nr:LLM class flavin-dependent oxidoreductase [Microbacterium sp. NIBRBAC000506063]QTV80482.1 LLM class flavin-dependent oxidoreductase [Microbacterium sp. NIBRBAC000506063]
MTFSVGYGPITVQRAADDPRQTEMIWQDALRNAREAEDAGFTSIWVGEHHFTPDGYLSGVFPFLGALAAATKRVLLGTKVLLAPLHHPIRVAEDAAAIQLLSGGRFVLGAAIGYREEEFEGLGVSLRDRRARLERFVRVCRAAWAGEPIPTGGDVRGSVDMPAVGAPIPIWLGGRAAPALRRVGRMADGYVAPVGPVGDLIAQVRAIDEASSEAGRHELPVASSSFVVLRGPGLGADRVRQRLDGLLGFYAQHKADDPYSRVGRPGRSQTMVIDGPPEEVATRLLEFKDAFPTRREHHHVVRIEFPGMTGDEVARSTAAFSERVLPELIA